MPRPGQHVARVAVIQAGQIQPFEPVARQRLAIDLHAHRGKVFAPGRLGGAVLRPEREQPPRQAVTGQRVLAGLRQRRGEPQGSDVRDIRMSGGHVRTVARLPHVGIAGLRVLALYGTALDLCVGTALGRLGFEEDSSRDGSAPRRLAQGGGPARLAPAALGEHLFHSRGVARTILHQFQDRADRQGPIDRVEFIEAEPARTVAEDQRAGPAAAGRSSARHRAGPSSRPSTVRRGGSTACPTSSTKC